jgi:hypothetical protein
MHNSHSNGELLPLREQHQVPKRCPNARADRESRNYTYDPNTGGTRATNTGRCTSRDDTPGTGPAFIACPAVTQATTYTPTDVGATYRFTESTYVTTEIYAAIVAIAPTIQLNYGGNGSLSIATGR